MVCKLPKGFLFDLSLSMESVIIKIISRHLRNMFYEAGKITQSAACPFLGGGGGGGNFYVHNLSYDCAVQRGIPIVPLLSLAAMMFPCVSTDTSFCM